MLISKKIRNLTNTDTYLTLKKQNMMNISRELIQMRLQINFVPNASIQTTDCLEYKINATFYKKKEMFNSHEIKEKNNGIDYLFFVSYSERKSDIPSLLLF